MFYLDPRKISSSQTKFSRIRSEEFFPTAGQPHQDKPVHVNSQEVTTKDVSGVHSGIPRKLNDWFPSVHYM